MLGLLCIGTSVQAQARDGCVEVHANAALPKRVAGAQRGVWIPTPDHTQFFDSPAEMERQLSVFQELGINTVYVAMWNAGRTLFPSETMRQLTGHAIDERMLGRNPLAEVVEAAKGKGIAVYAWFEFGFASDYLGGRGAEIVRLRPQWAALGVDGKPVEKNGFRWLNSLDPEVQKLLTSLMLEAATQHEIQGVQGDDRLPALPSSAGYNRQVQEAYRTEHGGRDPPRDASDSAWVQWRSDRLSGFMQRLHGTLKAAKPNLKISMSPSAFPWSKQEYLQDWPKWVKNGWVDSVSPQLYRRDLAAYKRELHKIAQEQVCPAQLGQVFPGVLLNLGKDYLASQEHLVNVVKANRQAGIGGEVFFFSEGLFMQQAVMEALYR